MHSAVFGSAPVTVTRSTPKSTPFLRVDIFRGRRLGYEREAGRGPERCRLRLLGAVLKDRGGYGRLVE